MNFKGFLKKTGFLNEDGDPDQEKAKNDYKINAYNRVFKYRKKRKDGFIPKNDPDECWNEVLNKARYKLTKRSSKDLRNAVQIAKGAIAVAQKRFPGIKDKLEDTEKETNIDKKIKNHIEDWTPEDARDLQQILKDNPEFKNFDIEQLSIPNLKGNNDNNFLETLSSKQKEELFTAMKGLETDDPEGKEWKDKTIEDIDSIKDEDFKKIQAELNKIPGFETVTDLEGLKTAMGKTELTEDQINALDKLLEPEKTPANQDPPATPNGTTPPETENRDKQNQMQEMEKKRKLERKLKDNDIPVKEDGTPDFDNPKTLEKINELMINGDDELYNEYILTKGGTQSDLAKMITDRQAKENELARTDLENRMARHEAEKDQQKAICNVALALDIFMAFFSGKVQDGFSTLANKRVQAAALSKQFDEGMNKKAFAEEDQKIENAHNKELDSIKTWEAQRMAEIEQDRQTPMGTQAYKRKYADLIKEKENKKQDFKNRKDAYMPKVDRKEKIDKFLFTLDTSTQIDINNPVIKELIPQNDGESPEDYAARLQTETNDPVKLKEKLQAESDEIQQTVENFNAEEKQIEDDFNKAAKDLENDPDVQSEFKDANAAYEFKKANIQAEMNVLRAKEQKRYEDRKSVNKQVFDERRRVLKNIATMGQWSSDPMSVFATEMQAFNKRAKELYESRGIPWNEGNDPLMSEDPEVLKQAMADYKKRMEQGQGQGQQQGKGRKDDETGGQRLQRPPFGGHKPNETGEGGEPDPEKKKTKPGEGQKQLTQLQTEFGQKPKAKKRLEAFLKEQDLDPEDPNYDTDLQNAIKEFKTKPFPEPANLTGQELEKLGITDADIPEDLKTKNITDLEAYAKYLKDNQNAAALEKLKEELGFPKSVGFNKQKLKAPEKADEINKLNLEGTISANGKDYDLKNLTPEDLTAIQQDATAKAKLEEKLKSVKALQEISKQELETTDDINTGSEGDPTQDPEDDEDKKHLSKLSLKNLWKKLNDAQISIRALPDYSPNWTPEQKRNAIIEYIKAHNQEIDDWKPLKESVNLKHRKTAFKRLNEMSQAQKRASDRRTLRKFSELLVKDFRDFT